MLTKLVLVVPCMVSASAFCQEMHPLVGVWQVTGIEGDCNCVDAAPGGTNTYIWHMHLNKDGSINISVQGNTAFPRLLGHWNSDTKTLIIDGYDTNGMDACWFKLTLDKKGILSGTRRFINGSGSRDHRPCFIDFAITAKKTSMYLG